MAYEKFKILKSNCVPLPIENIDTDQIIPARFLKATKRVGFGDNLFRDWKYNSDNTPKKEFVLNNKKFYGKRKKNIRLFFYINIYNGIIMG